MPTPFDCFVVEYSLKSGSIHICNSMREMVEANIETISKGIPKDYLPVGFAEDAEGAMKLGDKFVELLKKAKRAT